MEYLLHLLVLGLIYASLAVSLDLIVGHCGMLSLAHATFFGLGAYASAILTTSHSVSFTSALLVGAATSSVVALVSCVPVFRLRDDLLAIATFGLQVIALTVFTNWQFVTRGPFGISGIPRPGVLGQTMESSGSLAGLYFGLFMLLLMFARRVAWSPFGRVLRTIREDESFARAAGKNVSYFKGAVMVFGALMASVSGSMYAHYVGFVDPSSFGLEESILVLSMVIIGGAGSRWGAVIGALLLMLIPEVLRFCGLQGSTAAKLQSIGYGLLLVVIVIWRPAGLVGQYEFGK